MESEAHGVEDEDKVEDNLKMLNLIYIIASMWTAGEKQIGVLYNIGCQMDQSLKKWNFMPNWTPHLEWGISIFHAYGHRWMCQLWYHPRKSTIWGLSDGEGVTGYHQHLFILNLQVEHIDEEKWGDFGKWLWVHVDRAQSWLDEAKEKLAESTFSIEYLLHQFKEQHAYHSKPIMQQSKTQGACAIEHILSLQSTLEAQQENLWELISKGNDVIPEDSAGEAVLVEWQERVHLTKLAISQLQSNIKKRTEGLKLGDQVVAWRLEQLKKDRWITMQLNLCILYKGDGRILSDIKDNIKKCIYSSLAFKGGIYGRMHGLMLETFLMVFFLSSWGMLWSKRVFSWHKKWLIAVKRLVKEADDEVSFFALCQLHQLYEWLELWRMMIKMEK
ncbi:hypothetical protein BS47DRAFT_1365635 [Hydnum rufescens UP504]|uniref:Uncharacterized protein n=1 Tax=Hydnum rufescens UP504 TaxID=1448309 RepID=A0A9P6DRX1_9AGAM|nr:hypothetical protein BS47DRAFT_1365635 [Hydnum rufescens UP504]